MTSWDGNIVISFCNREKQTLELKELSLTVNDEAGTGIPTICYPGPVLKLHML